MNDDFENMDFQEIPTGTITSKHRFTFRISWPWVITLAIIGATVLFFTILTVQVMYSSRIVSKIYAVMPAPVAIVLGASVHKDGTPSDALYDRIAAAVSLYKNGTVKQLLLTGDDGKRNADEVDAMFKTTESLGVPQQDILVDGKGYRTYESCKRAIGVYHITNAIVVTQRFHLPRALFLCNELGINATGFVADRHRYASETWFEIRDLLASVKAMWDVYVHTPRSPVQ
jgi:vancomycin permeability regulator SanA